VIIGTTIDDEIEIEKVVDIETEARKGSGVGSEREIDRGERTENIGVNNSYIT